MRRCGARRRGEAGRGREPRGGGVGLGVPAHLEPHLRRPRCAVGAAPVRRRGSRTRPGVPTRRHDEDHLQAQPRCQCAGLAARVLGGRGALRGQAAPRGS
jgi:hypothetical protein